MESSSEELEELAELVSERNTVVRDIAKIIGRPAQRGHLGEFIASKIFNIELEESATQEGYDGRFESGPLEGRTVNIKYYGKQEGILDINPSAVPDFYLVLTGDKSQPVSSKGLTRPWTISYVYLFDGERLLEKLESRGVSIGIAASVRKSDWRDAEIYPVNKNEDFEITKDQREKIELFNFEISR